MESRKMLVTPAMAVAWLALNTGNRGINEKRVDAYANEMRAGRWLFTPHGIIFSTSGSLIDGQHRLSAIVRAGVSVEIMVTTNADEEIRLALDTGMPRTAAHEMQLQDSTLDHCSKRVATARCMYRVGGSSNPVVNTFILQLCLKYKPGLDFVVAQFPSSIRGITTAGAMAAIARAYMQPATDKQKLIEFCTVLRTGMVKSQDEFPAFLAREWLKENSGNGSSAQLLAYQKTARAIYACLKGEKITKLYCKKENYFPLDTDLAA